MRHASKWNSWVCAVFSIGFLILPEIPAEAARGVSQDPFTGDWLLSVHSASGQEISRYEMTLALKISQKGNFYNVALEIPTAYPETEYGGFSWVKFIAQSHKSLKNLTVRMAKQKYTGTYLMDIDGGSITHQNGSVTLKYAARTGMLCETGLGCFKKGNQSALTERYQELRQDNVQAKARADSEAKARARAEAAAKAAAEAEARKPRLAIDTTFTILPREDAYATLELAARTRVSFEVVVQRLNMDRIGRGNAVRIILLDGSGYAGWYRLQYKLSLASILGRAVKDTTTITGPCPALLKRDVQGPDLPPYTDGRATGACVLGAGKYYLIFYDGYPGFRVQGDQIGFSARLRVTTELLGPMENAGETLLSASPDGIPLETNNDEATESSQPALASKYQSTQIFKNDLSIEEVIETLHTYELSEERKGKVQLLEMNEAQGKIAWVQTIGDTGKTVTTKVLVEPLDSGMKVTVSLLGSPGLKIRKTSATREMGMVFAEVDKLSR